MRRSIIATAMAAGLTLALTACGGSTTPASPTAGGGATNQATPTTSAPPANGGKLTIWVDETRIVGFKKLGEQFKTDTGVTLDVVQKPSGDIAKDFAAQVPTGKGPDLIVTAHDGTGNLVKNGVVAPVELGDATAGLSKAALDGFRYEGQLYGVPYAVENIGLVRNNKLATETPATLDELIAAKPAAAQYPLLIQQGDQGDAYHLYPVQTSFGAPVFKQNDDGTFSKDLGMEGEPGHKFAAYLKTLTSKGVLNASIGGDQAKQAFLDGKSPYIVTGPWWTGEFTKAGMDITVLPVPSAGGQPATPFLGVQGVLMSSKSENALLANQFLTYVASEKTQEMLYETGGRLPANEKAAATVTGKDKILGGFADAGKGAAPMPNIPAMAAVWQFWGGTEISIINGKAANPTAAWDEMIKNIKSNMAG